MSNRTATYKNQNSREHSTDLESKDWMWKRQVENVIISQTNSTKKHKEKLRENFISHMLNLIDCSSSDGFYEALNSINKSSHIPKAYKEKKLRLRKKASDMPSYELKEIIPFRDPKVYLGKLSLKQSKLEEKVEEAGHSSRNFLKDQTELSLDKTNLPILIKDPIYINQNLLDPEKDKTQTSISPRPYDDEIDILRKPFATLDNDKIEEHNEKEKRKDNLDQSKFKEVLEYALALGRIDNEERTINNIIDEGILHFDQKFFRKNLIDKNSEELAKLNSKSELDNLFVLQVTPEENIQNNKDQRIETGYQEITKKRLQFAYMESQKPKKMNQESMSLSLDDAFSDQKDLKIIDFLLTNTKEKGNLEEKIDKKSKKDSNADAQRKHPLLTSSQMGDVLDFIFDKTIKAKKSKGGRNLKRSSSKSNRRSNVKSLRIETADSNYVNKFEKYECSDKNKQRNFLSYEDKKEPLMTRPITRNKLKQEKNMERDYQEKHENKSLENDNMLAHSARNGMKFNHASDKTGCQNVSLTPAEINQKKKIFFIIRKEDLDKEKSNSSENFLLTKKDHPKLYRDKTAKKRVSNLKKTEKTRQKEENIRENEDENDQSYEEALQKTRKQIKEKSFLGIPWETTEVKITVDQNDFEENDSDDNSSIKDEFEDDNKSVKRFDNNFPEGAVRRSLREKNKSKKINLLIFPRKSSDFTFVDYKNYKAQKINVTVSVKALLMMNLHAYLSTFEVIGLLGGQVYSQEDIVIEEAFLCKNLVESSNTHSVEMDPASQVETQEKLEMMEYKNLGWYHSHPWFKTTPSQIDQQTHLSHQICYKDHPYIGIIIGPYFGDKRSSKTKGDIFMFHVANEQTYKLNFQIKPVSYLNHRDLKNIEEMIMHYMGTAKGINLNDKWKKDLSYKDKIMKCFSTLLEDNSNCLKMQSEQQKKDDDPNNIDQFFELGTKNTGDIKSNQNEQLDDIDTFFIKSIANPDEDLLQKKYEIDLNSKQGIESLLCYINGLLQEANCFKKVLKCLCQGLV